MDEKTAPHPLAGDPGHEGGMKPIHSLKGGMAQPYVQQPLMGLNTGAPHPGPNAKDGESPDSGHMGGVMQNYTGAA